MNLVLVPLLHLELARYSFTLSGLFMLVVVATCFNVWILLLMVSLVLPSFLCSSVKLVMSWFSWAGSLSIWAGGQKPALAYSGHICNRQLCSLLLWIHRLEISEIR